MQKQKLEVIIPLNPCKKGHKLRYINGSCIACAQEYREVHRQKARDRINTIYKLNSEKLKQEKKEWRKKNPHKSYEYQKTWVRRNPEKDKANSALKRARKSLATPVWLSTEQRAEIIGIYLEAERKTKKTGIEHEVDHWAPLQNSLVCGLHVPWNLQILTAFKNNSKGNKFDEKATFRGKKCVLSKI